MAPVEVDRIVTAKIGGCRCQVANRRKLGEGSKIRLTLAVESVTVLVEVGYYNILILNTAGSCTVNHKHGRSFGHRGNFGETAIQVEAVKLSFGNIPTDSYLSAEAVRGSYYFQYFCQ